MPSKNKATQAIEQDTIALRRQRVQSLRNRGMTHEEIYRAIGDEFNVDGSLNRNRILNPATLQPYDRATITRDLLWLREDNLRLAREDVSIHQARQLAELMEIKRAAWAGKDPELALKALAQEVKLLGTLRQPDGINITINLELVVQTIDALRAAGADPEQTFRELIEAANARTRISNDSAL